MKILYCLDYDCIHNRDGVCGREEVSIDMRFGEFCSGERICYHDCRDYRERDSDG